MRLAARLTGWKLDIKNSSEYDQASEDEKVAELIALRQEDEALQAEAEARLAVEQAARAEEDARLRELYPLPEDDEEYAGDGYTYQGSGDHAVADGSSSKPTPMATGPRSKAKSLQSPLATRLKAMQGPRPISPLLRTGNQTWRGPGEGQARPEALCHLPGAAGSPAASAGDPPARRKPRPRGGDGPLGLPLSTPGMPERSQTPPQTATGPALPGCRFHLRRLGRSAAQCQPFGHWGNHPFRL